MIIFVKLKLFGLNNSLYSLVAWRYVCDMCICFGANRKSFDALNIIANINCVTVRLHPKIDQRASLLVHHQKKSPADLYQSTKNKINYFIWVFHFERITNNSTTHKFSEFLIYKIVFTGFNLRGATNREKFSLWKLMLTFFERWNNIKFYVFNFVKLLYELRLQLIVSERIQNFFSYFTDEIQPVKEGNP